MKTTIQSTLLMAGLCGALTSTALADPAPEHKASATHDQRNLHARADKPGATAKHMHTTPKADKTKSKKTPSKMTCTDFLELDEVVKPKLVYWAEGYNKKGKPEDAEFDVVSTDRLVPALVEVCTQSPQAPFLKKASEESHKHKK